MELFNFFKKKNTNTSKSESSLDEKQCNFINDMTKSAEFFVNSSSENFKGLDYSVKSLEVVENMLDEASDFYKQMDKEQQQNLITTVGSYIFEVARQNFGGKYFWYDKLNQPILVNGQPNFEASIIANDKVEKRLVNGVEDNIPFYFEGYVQLINAKKSGMIV
ncbi:hypothetical protein [Cellulophaga omnivescoria]|uniref:hypothetical protein n=1 Tax=Cellulophaga omnivescoria TaxID=1888890 RepID=UPI0022F0E4E5|nr:hypothetical protein [Cellulophaga omnivescoria]WBU89243.1 hypothetical protein PBN93_15395 [Cellulophaga omnivescoria]